METRVVITIRELSPPLPPHHQWFFAKVRWKERTRKNKIHSNQGWTCRHMKILDQQLIYCMTLPWCYPPLTGSRSYLDAKHFSAYNTAFNSNAWIDMEGLFRLRSKSGWHILAHETSEKISHAKRPIRIRFVWSRSAKVLSHQRKSSLRFDEMNILALNPSSLSSFSRTKKLMPLKALCKVNHTLQRDRRKEGNRSY